MVIEKQYEAHIDIGNGSVLYIRKGSSNNLLKKKNENRRHNLYSIKVISKNYIRNIHIKLSSSVSSVMLSSFFSSYRSNSLFFLNSLTFYIPIHFIF